MYVFVSVCVCMWSYLIFHGSDCISRSPIQRFGQFQVWVRDVLCHSWICGGRVVGLLVGQDLCLVLQICLNQIQIEGGGGGR